MNRIILIDILRCIAIISMIAFHWAYDLAIFYNHTIDYEHGLWKFVQTVLAGGLFIFVSGWTACLRQRSRLNLITIGLAALLVSLATYYQFGHMYVRFGILHFIFTANLLYTLTLHNKSSHILTAIAIATLLLTTQATHLTVSHPYMIWLDITPIDYQSVDHYPLLPWLAVFIGGIIWGRSPIAQKLSTIDRQIPARRHIINCSRHSLAIYILHQPIILTILTIYHKLY